MNLIRPRSIERPVTDEDDGTLAGFHVEHWSDVVDARVFGKRVHVPIPKDGLQIGDGVLFPWEPKVIGQRRDGSRIAQISGGAWGNSGLYLVNWIDIIDATQLAINTSLTTHKWAMYNNSITPNYSSDSVYSATNEVTGTGYTAGGQTIVSPTTTESPTGTLMYDMADQVWASPTTVTAFGAILYADALGDQLIVAMTFGGGFTSTAGTFTIQFNSLGVFTIDLTP